MSGDVVMALAQFAGQTVAAAAVTDVWEAARDRVAGLLGRGDAHKTQAVERWLVQTREQLGSAGPGTAMEQVRGEQAQRWAARFADLLDEDPEVEAELPRVFRTGNLRLNHAASCPFRYSSKTSCGVR